MGMRAETLQGTPETYALQGAKRFAAKPVSIEQQSPTPIVQFHEEPPYNQETTLFIAGETQQKRDVFDPTHHVKRQLFATREAFMQRRIPKDAYLAAENRYTTALNAIGAFFAEPRSIGETLGAIQDLGNEDIKQRFGEACGDIKNALIASMRHTEEQMRELPLAAGGQMGARESTNGSSESRPQQRPVSAEDRTQTIIATAQRLVGKIDEYKKMNIGQAIDIPDDWRVPDASALAKLSPSELQKRITTYKEAITLLTDAITAMKRNPQHNTNDRIEMNDGIVYIRNLFLTPTASRYKKLNRQQNQQGTPPPTKRR